MRQNRWTTSALLLVAIHAACAPARTARATDVEAAIVARATAFSRAFEKGDGAALAGFYTDDAVLMPPGGSPRRSPGSILEFWSGRAPDFHVLSHSLTADRLDVHGDFTVDEGEWSNTTQWRDQPPRTSSGRYLVVWRRGADGLWRMQYDMWHPPLPLDTAAGGVTAITNVSVVPMTSDTVLVDQTVLIGDGRIIGIGSSTELRPPAGAHVIDAAGRYLVPGLIDTHVHIRAASELDSYLRFGVTTVLNMRGTPEHLRTRDAIRSGEMQGPRMYTAGPLLDGDPPIWSGDGTRVVTSAASVPAVVSEIVRAGYDFVKTYNNLDPAVLRAVVSAAHEEGRPVVSHLPRRPVRAHGLRAAMDAGIDVIAHGEEVFFTHFGGASDSLIGTGRYSPPTDAELREVADLIDRAGVAVAPNLSFIAMTARMLEDLDGVFADPEFDRLDPGVREMWREQNPTRRVDLASFRVRERAKYDVVRRLTRALHEAGVPLLVGTDASAPGLFPGASTHIELAELVSAGLTPWAALAAATSVPGTFIARELGGLDSGIVAVGNAADLLLVDGNPLESVETLRTPWRVLRAGRIVYSR